MQYPEMGNAQSAAAGEYKCERILFECVCMHGSIIA
jgi:hypothetical protein